jgi:uncharacterized protein involved in outer membrane biogenesis
MRPHTPVMKRLIKWAFLLVLALVGVVVGLVYFKDPITKAALEQQIRAQTGMDVKIEKLSIGLLSPIARIENLTLYNPADFGGVPFLRIRELHAEYDREALARRELRLRLLRLNVAELTVVQNDLGQTNVLVLAAAPARPSGEAVSFQCIEVATLSVAQIAYVDLRNQRNNRKLTVNLENQVQRNLMTAAEFFAMFAQVWKQKGGG